MIYGEYATYVSPVYYLFVYQEDTYVGHFQIICYAEEPPYFYWADFEHLDLMTLEQAIQSAQLPVSEE
jgi:hypothetical protein